MELKARDLIAAGWPEGPRLGTALRRGRELEASGLTRDAVLAQLASELPKLPVLAALRSAPASFAEAIRPEGPAELANVAKARAKMQELLAVPVIRRGALMPDTCPAGNEPATIPVGGAIEVENALIPGAHSADICCSMFCTFFESTHPTAFMLDQLQAVTHFGPGGRPRGQQHQAAVLDEPIWDNRFLSGLRSRAQDFLGTQGDGNHFASVGRIAFSPGQIRALESAGYGELARQLSRGPGEFSVLVTHHGSRGLGADVYKRGQIAARAFCAANARDIPDAAVWLPADSAVGADYWEALQYVSRWTRANHEVVHESFLRRLGLRASAQVGNEHNFVWRRGDTYLHGKGATPAWKDAEGRPLLGLIPLNMAREILLVLGGGNDTYLSFAPHGAGRNLSRTALMRPYRNEDGETDPAQIRQLLADLTPGLDIRWFTGTPDLSESPLGYKDASAVKAQIGEFGLAQVVGEVQPRGCLMAGEPGEQRWMRARREKRAAHKSSRREGQDQVGEG